MSSNANFAATPLIGSGTTTTADTTFTAPTNSTVGVIFTAPLTGARIDTIDNITLGTSVAGMHRLWLCEGVPGPTVSTATFSTTTATITTATSHGLSTGNLVTLQGAFPNEYNMRNVAITVTGLTTFTYTMTTAPTVNATTVPEFASTPATAVYHLLEEVPITAITGSTTVQAFTYSLNQIVNGDLLPLILPPGWSLRTTVSVTQTHALKSTARGGKF
jgi:hypothetical protein